MAQDYQESVIQIDHGAKIASAWTIRKGVARRLERLGWTKVDRQGPGYWYSAPAKAVSFRKVRQLPVISSNAGHFKSKPGVGEDVASE